MEFYFIKKFYGVIFPPKKFPVRYPSPSKSRRFDTNLDWLIEEMERYAPIDNIPHRTIERINPEILSDNNLKCQPRTTGGGKGNKNDIQDDDQEYGE